MKVVFLLDNNEYVEVDPTLLQIRQIAPGQSALGIEVTVPVKDGKEGETQQGFRPFVNYAVNLSVPEPLDAVSSPALSEVPAVKPLSVTKIAKRKRSK